MKKFRFPADGDVRQDVRDSFGYDGELLEIYAANKGAVVHKLHHYLPLYDRYIGHRRGTPVKFLEIGVSKGGSLQMWRKWLGPDAVLCGIDINPDCAQFDGQAGMVRIGSQADATFLGEVVDEMGGVDVVLDDGSHRMDHVRASLRALFPRVSSGGTYVIEDLHTAYWPKYGGGLGDGGNFFAHVGEMIDDMHAWYHPDRRRHKATARSVTGIHVHDSMVIFDKSEVRRPTHSRVG
jgi:hypothetical protein